MPHVADRLQALLSGAAPLEERAAAEAHLAACARCREERDLLASARPVVPPLPPLDPRAGFAAKVAFNARDRRGSPMGRWLRWMVGGACVATATFAAALLLTGRMDPRGDSAVLAQRLDLFEDLAVLQNRDALEDLEVVSVLHTLEVRP
jgi:predicted anti-sigma-YlaC factor YlaD